MNKSDKETNYHLLKIMILTIKIIYNMKKSNFLISKKL